MVQESVFGLHTAEFKRWISRKEANSIKAYFNLNPDEKLTGSTYFYQYGVTKIWLEEIKGKKPRYYLHMIVNFSRVLGISNYRAMPYTPRNVKKVFTAMNKVLKALPLSSNNAVFPDWTRERFDSVFDIYEEHTELQMQLLNQSVNLSDRKKRCNRIPIQGKTAQELECQSMRFGNNSFTYNIYRKIEEIQDKGKSITEEEKAEVQHLLRIERQNHKDAFKELVKTAGDLANANVHDDILKTMIDEMEMFFGKGDFYSWKGITKKYYPDHKADIDLIENVMKQITLNSFGAAQGICTKDVSNTFDKLRLSPVGIKQECGIDFIQGIYNRIIKAYPRPPDKRRYGSFPSPCRTGDGRFKATIILYNANSGRKQISVAGRTIEQYEEKVSQKLKETYLLNRLYLKSDDPDKQDMILKSADYIRRFHKAAKTETVKQDAEEFIESVIQIDEKRFSNCPAAADSG